MLSLASMLFVGVMAVNAQVTPESEGSASGSTSQPTMTDDQSNYTRDMQVIQSSDVPSSLKSTLQGSEYSGWEDGKVYHNSSTNEYLVVIGEEDAKVYRFDSNGSRIEDSSSDSNSSGSLNSGSSETGAPESESTSGSVESTPSSETSGSGSTTSEPASGSTSGSTLDR